MKPALKASVENLPAIGILVEAGEWPPKAKLRALTGRALGAVIAVARPRLDPASEVSLVFTDDAHIRVLNRKYRRKDKATNVLSFPAPRHPPKGFSPLIGDLVFAAETIAGEAREERLVLDHHLAHLIVHGFLHLLGHDHERAREAADMERLETAILARLGIGDPYAPGKPTKAG